MQIPIWPGAAPDAQPVAGPEYSTTTTKQEDIIAGRPFVYVEQVSRPTMTVYSPNGKEYGRRGGGVSWRGVLGFGD
jgi:hypothetical protein